METKLGIIFCLGEVELMGKKLMSGKNPKSRGKKMSHGNSHVSPDEVEWNRHTRKLQVRSK